MRCIEAEERGICSAITGPEEMGNFSELFQTFLPCASFADFANAEKAYQS